MSICNATFYIDPNLEVTETQRALIVRNNLEVSLAHGHIFAIDKFASKRLGQAAGKRIIHQSAGPKELNRILTELEEIHNLAERNSMNPEIPIGEAIKADADKMAEQQPSMHDRVAAATKKAQIELNKPTKKSRNKAKDQAKLAPKAAPVTPAAAPKAAPVTPAAAPKAPRTGGVIAALLEILSTGRFTRNELYDELVKRFPDRATDSGGMRITIGVQLNALKSKGHNILSAKEERGNVYYLGK